MAIAQMVGVIGSSSKSSLAYGRGTPVQFLTRSDNDYILTWNKPVRSVGAPGYNVISVFQRKNLETRGVRPGGPGKVNDLLYFVGHAQ